jgi:hypothetical protein
LRVRCEGRHARYSIASESLLEMPRLGEELLYDNLEHVEALRDAQQT